MLKLMFKSIGEKGIIHIIILIIILVGIGLGIYITQKNQILRSRATSTDSPDILLNDIRYPSTPKKVNTGDYLIGTWFYPAWHWQEDTLNRWTHLSVNTKDQFDYVTRLPLLNPIPNDIRYPGEKSWTMDYHIKWALEHGIGFFIFDWYWLSPDEHPEKGGSGHEAQNNPVWGKLNNEFVHAFKTAQYKDKIQFAIM